MVYCVPVLVQKSNPSLTIFLEKKLAKLDVRLRAVDAHLNALPPEPAQRPSSRPQLRPAGSSSQPVTPFLVRPKPQGTAQTSVRPTKPAHRAHMRAANGKQQRSSEVGSRTSAPASPRTFDEYSTDGDVFVSAPATPRSRSGSSTRSVPPDISQLIRELSRSAANSPQMSRRKLHAARDDEHSGRHYYRYRSSRSPSNDRSAFSSRKSLTNSEYDEQLADVDVDVGADFGDSDTLTASRHAVGEPEEPEADFQTRWTITKERLKDWDDDDAASQPQPQRALPSHRGQSAPASPAVRRRTLQPKPPPQQPPRSLTPSASGALRQPVPQWDAPAPSQPTSAAGYFTSRSHQSLPPRHESPPPERSLPVTRALLPSCLALFDEARGAIADDASDENVSRAVTQLSRVLVRPLVSCRSRCRVHRTALFGRLSASCVDFRQMLDRVDNVPKSQVNICSLVASLCIRAIICPPPLSNSTRPQANILQ